DTVNTAARLQSAAPPGHTLVSAATHELAHHAFAFEKLGDTILRGKADPVAVFRLVGVAATPGAARGLAAHGLAAPLIGRDESLAQLLAAFDRVVGGHAELVSLTGEVGAGKSRLVQEFLARLQATGRLERVTLRRAACASLGEPAYGVVGALFRQAFGIGAGGSVGAAPGKGPAGPGALAAAPDEAAWGRPR